MASQVNVNALTVVHAGSDGVAPSFPDVCLTPSPVGPPIPVPYPNLARSVDTAQGTKSVLIEGHPVMVQGAVFATSTGDEAGSAGGVVSATTKGKARFVNYSFDVKLDGKCVARLGDPMTHNELGGANTTAFPEVQPPCPMRPPIDSCDDADVDQLAATPVQNQPSHVFVWDRVSERQWVNLPAEWGPDCGRRVTLVGHIEPRDAGRAITFQLLPDAANPPRNARAELASATARSDSDGVVRVDVELPIYGGARFQVSARTVRGQFVPSPFLRWTYGETIRPEQATFTTQEDPNQPQPLVDVQVLDQFDGKAIITARVPHPHPWKVLVRLRYWVQAAKSPVGWGGPDGALRVCVGDMRKEHPEHELVPLICHVMTHEIGHALGLVPERASWHDPALRDKKYNPKHCHHLHSDGSPECVMWFNTRAPDNFCSSHEPHNCTHYLRAADLSKVKWV